MKKITCEIWIDPDKFKFKNHVQRQAFERALGRQIAYAVRYGGHDTHVRGAVSIGKDITDLEICFTYTPCESGEITFSPMSTGFTMAAVARKEGTEYTYHS